MRKLLTALAKKLDSNGNASLGHDFFVMKMPDDVKEGAVLLDYLVGNEIFQELPGYRKGRFLLSVRALSYEEGTDRAQELSDALFALKHETLEGVDIRYIYPRHDPVAYPDSKGDVREYAVVFDAAYILT